MAMFHFRTIILVALIGLLVASGVLEIKFHPTRLGGVGTTLTNLTKGQSWTVTAGYYFSKSKRFAEQQLVGDHDKRLDMALDYIHEDSQKISQIVTAAPGDTPVLEKQVNLMQDAIRHTKAAMEKVSADTLVNRQSEINSSFQAAGASLKQIQAAAAAKADDAAELNKLAQSLAGALGNYAHDEDGAVAGTKDESGTPSNTFKPAPDIPLSF